MRRWRAEAFTLRADWNAAADKKALAERMVRLGIPADADLSQGYPEENSIKPAPPGSPWTNAWNDLQEAGIAGDSWRCHLNGTWFFGETLATPVSDGRRVDV